MELRAVADADVVFNGCNKEVRVEGFRHLSED